MKLKTIEIRRGDKGEEFVVETLYECESEKKLRQKLDEEKPSSIVDKNYRIKKAD